MMSETRNERTAGFWGFLHGSRFKLSLGQVVLVMMAAAAAGAAIGSFGAGGEFGEVGGAEVVVIVLAMAVAVGSILHRARVRARSSESRR